MSFYIEKGYREEIGKMSEVKDIVKEYNIPVVQIDDNRNYWLVRTQAGEYHQEFYFDNYIAIGWNEFNNPTDFTHKDKSKEKKKVVDTIGETYEDTKQPGRIYNQIRRFWYEMKPGDIVMIPTHNSQHVSFGTIKSDAYIKELSESSLEEGVCPFQKRRDIEWIKTVKKDELDPYLYKMMHTQNTINNANDYAPFIDRTLHSLYLKNGRAHLVIHVKKEGNIPAIDLLDFVNNVINLLPEVNELELTDKKYDKRKDLDLKLNVQSPGVVEFFSDAPFVILGIGILLVFLVGGKAKATFTKKEKNIEASSKGLAGMIFQFIKHKDEHELKKLQIEHQQAMERIKAKIPEELKNLPDLIDQEDENQ